MHRLALFGLLFLFLFAVFFEIVKARFGWPDLPGALTGSVDLLAGFLVVVVFVLAMVEWRRRGRG